MADIKVSEMPETTSANIDDLIMIIQGGGNKKITEKNLLGDRVVVSPTEPTGDNRKKVWFQKGKNLFNINDIVTSVYIETNGLIGNSSVSNTSGFIKVSKGNLTLSYEYTTLLNVGTRAYVFYDNNKSVLSGGTYLNSNKITKLSCPQDGYVRFSYDKNVNNIQLEYGDNKTAYEAYIEPKIFIKDDNNIYEEFIKKQEEIYSTDKVKIGTWTNGAVLYRKVISSTLPKVTTDGTYARSTVQINENINFGYIEKAFYTDIYDGRITLPWITGSGRAIRAYLDVPGQQISLSSNATDVNERPVTIIVNFTLS